MRGAEHRNRLTVVISLRTAGCCSQKLSLFPSQIPSDLARCCKPVTSAVSTSVQGKTSTEALPISHATSTSARFSQVLPAFTTEFPCYISVPGSGGADATARVRSAFATYVRSLSAMCFFGMNPKPLVCRHCAAAAAAAGSELEGMRLRLLQYACTADMVLDLHCCFDASTHIFTLPSQAARFTSLSARLNCAALLTADVSGGNSFDEACSVPWHDLSRQYPGAGLDENTCAACESDTEHVSSNDVLCLLIRELPGTVELGGMADTEPDVATASCEAILAFLWENNYIAQGGGLEGADFLAAPAATCDATPLAGVHEVMPPHAGKTAHGCALNVSAPLHELSYFLTGVVSFMVGIGARVQQGQPLFQVCDPVADKVTTVCSPGDGCMYNRERLRFAQSGLWICKVTCDG